MRAHLEWLKRAAVWAPESLMRFGRRRDGRTGHLGRKSPKSCVRWGHAMVESFYRAIEPRDLKSQVVLVIAHESSGGREDNDDRGRERKEDGEDGVRQPNKLTCD